MSSLTVQDLTKAFGATPVLTGVDLHVPSRSFTALLGPSGCGKTTLLRLIAGFDEPDAGTVAVADRTVVGAGRSVPARSRGIGFVPQEGGLFPHLTVAANVAFGLPRRQRRDRVRIGELLELVGLSPDLAERAPHQLSGGQQQRVALARALVNRPRALLLDEPLGALDLRLRRQLQIELKRIQQEVGITFVHVTHDQEEAMTMADEIAVMSEGRIEQRGSATDLYEHPRTEFVANFLGISNLIDARLRGGNEYVTADGDVIRAPAAREGAVRVGVRPEKLAIVDPGADADGHNVLRGTVEVAAFLGTSLQYLVRTPSGHELTVIEQNRDGGAHGPGREVALTWRPEHTFVVSREEPAHAA